MAEYSDYGNDFLVENKAELLKYIKINDHAIKLKKDKQLFFGSIKNLELVELGTLKTYIKINLTNNFIQSFKFSVKVFNFFDWKLNNSC